MKPYEMLAGMNSGVGTLTPEAARAARDGARQKSADGGVSQGRKPYEIMPPWSVATATSGVPAARMPKGFDGGWVQSGGMPGSLAGVSGVVPFRQPKAYEIMPATSGASIGAKSGGCGCGGKCGPCEEEVHPRNTTPSFFPADVLEKISGMHGAPLHVPQGFFMIGPGPRPSAVGGIPVVDFSASCRDIQRQLRNAVRDARRSEMEAGVAQANAEQCTDPSALRNLPCSALLDEQARNVREQGIYLGMCNAENMRGISNGPACRELTRLQMEGRDIERAIEACNASLGSPTHAFDLDRECALRREAAANAQVEFNNASRNVLTLLQQLSVFAEMLRERLGPFAPYFHCQVPYDVANYLQQHGSTP